MPRPSTPSSGRAGGSDRSSLYREITSRIIAELEAGRLPWVQPWGTSAVQAPLALPRNATTGRRYSGINVLILWGAVVQQGFSSQSWLTFRQALALGGHTLQKRLATIAQRGGQQVPTDSFDAAGTVITFSDAADRPPVSVPLSQYFQRFAHKLDGRLL